MLPTHTAELLPPHFITTLVAQTANKILGLSFRAGSNPEPRALGSVAPLLDSALPAQGLQQDETGTRDPLVDQPCQETPPVTDEDDYKPMILNPAAFLLPLSRKGMCPSAPSQVCQSLWLPAKAEGSVFGILLSGFETRPTDEQLFLR